MADVTKVNGTVVADNNAIGRTMQVVKLAKSGLTAAEVTSCVAAIQATGTVSAIDLQTGAAFLLVEGTTVAADSSDAFGVTGVVATIEATFAN
jgi:phage tail tape-measure protein